MRIRFALVVAAALLLPAAASAKQPAVRFLICQPGGPDLRAEQQATVERLYRYIETKTGLEKGRIEGLYTNDRAKCLDELAKKPEVFFPSLPIFLEMKARYGLRPVAQLELEGKFEDHFYLVAATDTTFTIDEIAGRTLTGTHLGSKRFVLDVVLDKKVADDAVKLQPERLGLRAVRKVVKGRTDAVLLDGSQYRALQGTRYEKKLRLLARVGPTPTPPVAVLAGEAPRGFPEALGAALVGMKNDDVGREVLEMFDIEGFGRPGPRAFASLEARVSGAN